MLISFLSAGVLFVVLFGFLHDSDVGERTARAWFVETLFVSGTEKLEAYCARFISGVFPKHRQRPCVFYQLYGLCREWRSRRGARLEKVDA